MMSDWSQRFSDVEVGDLFGPLRDALVHLDIQLDPTAKAEHSPYSRESVDHADEVVLDPRVQNNNIRTFGVTVRQTIKDGPQSLVGKGFRLAHGRSLPAEVARRHEDCLAEDARSCRDEVSSLFLMSTKSERRAARETVAAYHEARLAELVGRVGEAVDRFRAGELDAFDTDQVIFQNSRAAKELWKFCNLSDVVFTAQLVAECAPTDWWERGTPRRR